MRLGFDFEVVVAGLQRAEIRAEFGGYLDQTNTIALGVTVGIVAIEVQLGGSELLAFTPHFTTDSHRHIAAHEEGKHGSTGELFVAAIQIDDAAVELAAQGALPAGYVSDSDRFLWQLKARRQNLSKELESSFELDGN
ncbi:hypothetical protein D3C73_1195480 [compost metagenome]